MTKKEHYDAYASELTQRFEELMRWAITNWPREDFPLMTSDFDSARRNFAEIAGPKLGEPAEGDRPADRVPDPPGLAPDRDRQFRDMNPMPWP